MNQNEKRLLSLLGAAVFVLLNIFVLKWFIGKTQEVRSKIDSLRQTAADYRTGLQERSYWEERQKWMSVAPMETRDGREADSRFAEQIQKSVTQFGLAIETQQLHEPEIHEGMVEVSLEITIKGRLEPIIRWMNEVQQPGKYIAIKAFTLRRFDEGSDMVVKLSIGRIFSSANHIASP